MNVLVEVGLGVEVEEGVNVGVDVASHPAAASSGLHALNNA